MNNEKSIDFYVIKEAISMLANVLTRETDDMHHVFMCPFCDFKFEDVLWTTTYWNAKSHLMRHIGEKTVDFIKHTKVKWDIQIP